MQPRSVHAAPVAMASSAAPRGQERYGFVRDLGSGNFGVARLMQDRVTGELVAIKYIDRGDRVRCRRQAEWAHAWAKGRLGVAHWCHAPNLLPCARSTRTWSGRSSITACSTIPTSSASKRCADRTRRWCYGDEGCSPEGADDGAARRPCVLTARMRPCACRYS